MPFTPPNDPLLMARIEHCEKNGGHGFGDIQLPEAIARLRQGSGRLIRSLHDRGVIALLDSRIYSRSYGREVARNLPGAPICDDLSEIRWFFEGGPETACPSFVRAKGHKRGSGGIAAFHVNMK
jgi:ATP-dependent DNA helicase DinG